MNKQRALVLISILVLLFFIGYFFLSLYLTYRERQDTFQDHFSLFSERAFSAYRSGQLSPKEMADFLRPSAESLADAALLFISDPAGRIQYLYMNDSGLRESLPAPEQLTLSLLEEQPESGGFLTLSSRGGSSGGPLTAGGFYRKFSREDIFLILKPLFPALALFTLLLLFTILGTLSGKARSQESIEMHQQGNSDEKHGEEADHAPSSAPPRDDTVPASPYSPATGLAWESFLKDRLDNELKRSASSEQELSFSLITCPQFHSPLMYANMAKKLKRVFTMSDLLFEYTFATDKAFAVIMPDTELVVAIDLLKEFLNDADLSGDQCSSGASAGLSSRSGRLVNASLLIKEAAGALKKAQQEPETNIIGFKPDPGKFRDYLAAKRDEAVRS